MDKHYVKWLGLLFFAATANAQTDVTVDYQKYPDYSPVLKPDYALRAKAGKASRSGQTQTRPAYVNNAETPYFPPVFNQDGGSCGSASRISYMFNYELNALRGLDGSLEENQYPSHFTWLLTNSNSGKEGMAVANGVPNVTVYGGRTYSRLFGNQDCSDPDFGWMQGYDKWYHAMCNRISRNANFPDAVNTEAGREAVKNWIWNHNGDNDFYAGGIVGIGVASGGNWQPIPSSPTNIEIGVVGKRFVKNWGTSVDHALTIVGYDDRIEFDLDENGVVGEADKDEVGAWIIVNSWGSGWCNNGFIYCPYAHAASYYVTSTGQHAGYWAPEIYYARKNYRPLRTFKITMEYSKRSELCLSAGISTNLNATEPDATTIFEHFKYAGDGDGNGVDAETPMLGRWADGMHYEPMEFGYDLTDFSSRFDTRKPLKYFFIVETKASASGTGTIHGCSLIDYEFDKEGIELPFDLPEEGVTIQNKGNKTIISCIVPGEPINAPQNLVYNDAQLTWDAPAKSTYTFEKYNIYRDGEYLMSTTERQAAVEDASAIYTVTAVYALADGESIESNKSNATYPTYEAPATRNQSVVLREQGFTIPELFPSGIDKATIEFWIRPLSLISWNQHIGPGWGTFLFHANGDGSVSVGWNSNSTGDRYNSSAGLLRTNTWQHIAIVVDKNVLTLYKDGTRIGSTTSTSNSGLSSINEFSVGRDGSTGINAYMDEFRVWDEARTLSQIQAYKDIEIAIPEAETHLQAYYKMRQPIMEEADGTEKLRDYSVNRRHATIIGNTPTLSVTTNLLNDEAAATAAIGASDTTTYAGGAIAFESQHSPNAIQWAWSAPGSKEQTASIPNPTFTFEESGTYTVTLTVTANNGTTAEANATITVRDVEAPVADFTLSTDEAAAGDRIMLVNKTTGEGCTYEWTMNGSDQGAVTTTNAAVSYPQEGVYVVTLTATNAAGSSTHNDTVNITKVKPQSIFNVSPAVVLKGEQVTLEDQSKYSPDEWTWNVSSTGHTIKMNGQSGIIVPDKSGVYDVSLQTVNDLGESTTTQKRALVVCNAESGNGLNFSGGSEYVDFGAPFTSTTLRTFSIEWWMNPNRNIAQCHQIGDSEETFLIRVNAMGAMTIYARGNEYTTANNVVIPSEWHHYAVSYSNGTVSIWRDGERLESQSVSSRYAPVMSKFRLSDENAPLNAIIDELRVWSKSISEARIMQYSNAPITDVVAAEADGLLLYCDFNQNSGNVIDATSNQNSGERVNFGPEGDAWSSTRGVFCLGEKPQDVTADYLTNYKAPFVHTDQTVSTGARFQELETETAESGWILENTVVDTDRNSTTGFFVDGGHDDNLTVMTFTNNFATSLTDHKAYQTVTLPAGTYQFTVTEGDNFSASGSYLAVSLGKGLPDTDDLSASTIAYAPLADKSLTFTVEEESEVSIGMVINMSGANYLCISELSLIRSGLTVVNAGDITGVEDVTTSRGSLQILVENGGVYLTTQSATPVSIYTTGGALIYQGEVNGSKRLDLAKGIYLINSQKVIIK